MSVEQLYVTLPALWRNFTFPLWLFGASRFLRLRFAIHACGHRSGPGCDLKPHSAPSASADVTWGLWWGTTVSIMTRSLLTVEHGSGLSVTCTVPVSVR